MAKGVIDRDLGLKRIMREIRRLDGIAATVGVHADEETRESGELSNVMLAVIHEYGAPMAKVFGRPGPGIPERSFIRSTFDKNVKKYEGLLAKFSKLPPKQAVALVAEVALADIINAINASIPPPLSPLTIKLKGSSKPLIDTGQLKGSLKIKVGRL